MKTSMFKLFVVVILFLAGVSLIGAAQAGSPVYHFTGEYANALFSDYDGIGCVVNEVYIFAGENVSHTPPARRAGMSEALVQIAEYDLCAQELLSLKQGYTLLPDSAFQVANKIESATLAAMIEVLDELGEPSHVTINLTWTATGPIVRTKSSSYTHAPDCKINTHYNGTQRVASVSGSISDGTTEFTTLPLIFANIGTDKAGEITIGCGG